MTLTQTLAKSWKIIFKAKKLFFLAVLFDLVFFIVLAQLYWVFFTPATDAALKATNIIQQEMEKLSETADISSLNEAVMQNPEFLAAYHQLLKIIGLFLLASLGVWIVFKGFAWWFSHKSVKKITLKKFFPNFAWRSIAWFAIFIVYLFAMFWIAGRLAFAKIPGTGILNTILWAGLVALGYFAQLSLASIPQKFKNAFILGVKNAKKVVFVYAFNLLLLLVLFTTLYYAARFNIYAGIAVFFILALPSLAFTRTNLLVATWLKTSSQQ